MPYAEFADPQSLNLYTYVRNVPTTRFDADGHFQNIQDQSCPAQNSVNNFANKITHPIEALKGAARYLSNAVNDTLSALSGGELGAPHLELTNPDQHAGANITNQLLAATPVLGELKATTATVEVVDAAVSLETTPSESPAVTRVLQTIDEGGFEVTANPKSATQTGNVTITNPSEPGVKLNLRSETHPIPGSGGQPVPHVNVERVEPGPKNRPEVVSNTHIDQ